MGRRKENDKRVLRPGNGRQQKSRRKLIRKNNRQVFSTNNKAPKRRRKKAKSNNKLVFFMIFALVAFVIGAGIGVSLSFDDGTDEGPKYENVTKEMTQNLNETNVSYYDSEVDGVDFNENTTSQLDVNYPSYGEGEDYQYNESSAESEDYVEEYYVEDYQ